MATEVMRMRQEHEAQMTTLRNQCEVTLLRADADLSEQVCATLSAPPCPCVTAEQLNRQSSKAVPPRSTTEQLSPSAAEQQSS